MELLTHKSLAEHLNKIGYKIQGEYPNRFIYNHKDENIGVRVWNETLSLEGQYVNSTFIFDIAQIRMIEDNCVSISGNGAFMNLFNFDNLK